MSAETLLVLAAAAYQTPVIARAKAMGVRVITADNRPENPGHQLAEKAFNVSTTDVGAILTLARAERISGLIAAATDVAVTTAAAVGGALGLTAPSTRAAAILCDKPAFRAFQRREGLPHPETHVIGRDGAFSPADGEVWVIKPDRASGSKGIKIVSSPAEVAGFLPEAQQHALGGVVLAEAFLPGAQGTIEGVLENGRIAMRLVTDRITAPAPFVATHGHRTPATHSASAIASLCAQIEHIAAALQLRSGPFDADFVADGDTATLIELTPRLGGNSMMRLVEAATGFALIDYAILHALGRAPRVRDSWSVRPTAVQLLGSMSAGKLAFDAAEAERLRTEPWIERLEFDTPAGTSIAPFTDGRYRVGEAMFHAESRDALDQRASELLARLNVRAL